MRIDVKGEDSLLQFKLNYALKTEIILDLFSIKLFLHKRENAISIHTC
jgi:hypothetical protein